MTWWILLAGAVLAGVAVAGVLRPFGAPHEVVLERLADPLEDERLGLLRALKDLDEERSEGSLAEDDYRALRGETEARAIAVLRALEAREGGGELAPGLREMRPPGTLTFDVASRNGSSAEPRTRRAWVPATIVGIVAVGLVVLLLVRAVANRGADQPITGSGVGGGQTALSFFVQRVAQHPNDLAARLDLAQAYLDGGDVQDAVQQYLEALRINPTNADAQSHLGYVLFLSGHPAAGLDAVNKALATSPTDAEALYFKGVILLRGTRRPAQAAQVFRQYLADAPFGSRRAEVQQLLVQAQASSKP